MSMQQKIEEFAKACGKNVLSTIAFTRQETFGANSDAEAKAKELGYTVGSMQRDEPRACARNVSRIAKWWDIDAVDRHRVEAGLISDDFRNGPVFLVILTEAGQPEPKEEPKPVKTKIKASVKRGLVNIVKNHLYGCGVFGSGYVFPEPTLRTLLANIQQGVWSDHMAGMIAKIAREGAYTQPDFDDKAGEIKDWLQALMFLRLDVNVA